MPDPLDAHLLRKKAGRKLSRGRVPKTPVIYVYVDAKTWKAVEVLARHTGRSSADIGREAIHRYLKEALTDMTTDGDGTEGP